jgi:Homeodomain-like domain
MASCILKIFHLSSIFRACVNPDHLFLGSDFENQQDAARKGRIAGQKLTVKHIHAIREALAGGMCQAKVAAAYGVSQSHISRINSRDCWNHI